MAEIVEQEGWRVRLRDRVPAEEVEAAYRALLNEYRKRVKVPGFRPGRVPDRVLEARLGREALLAEVREDLVERRLPRLLEETGVRAVAIREVEGELELGRDFTYELELERYPEVKLPEWRSLKLELESPEITDKDVEAALQRLRERFAEVEAKEGPAEEGDVVIVVLEGGDELALALDRAHSLVREALLGKRAGEAVELPVSSAEGEPTGEVARGEVREVRAVRLPELDEEFAKTLGYADLAEARAKVREELERQLAAELLARKKEALLEHLAEGLEAAIPPTMIRDEEGRVWEEIADNLAVKGVPFEDYIKSLDEEKLEELKAEVRKSAERRVRRGLALERLVADLGVELSDEERSAYLDAFAREHGVDPARMREALSEAALERILRQRLYDKALTQAVELLRA